MLIGGLTTVYLTSGVFPVGAGDGFLGFSWQTITLPYQLDPNVFGISASAVVFVAGSLIYPDD
jgi:hypothetical protein